MKTVNRYTRAGKHGKEIICPKCYESYPVYHFAWSALVCTCCKETIEKNEYLLEQPVNNCIQPFIPNFHD